VVVVLGRVVVDVVDVEEVVVSSTVVDVAGVIDVVDGIVVEVTAA
jgi:hypothetical protein